MKSAMSMLSAALTAACIAHQCDAAEDNSTDDSIEISTASKQGYDISVQCANECTPRGQQDYLITLWDEAEETFHHLAEQDTASLQLTVASIADLISGKKVIEKN